MTEPFKTHSRSKHDELKSDCGKGPPRCRNLSLTDNEQDVTCWQCARKIKALKNGRRPFVKMHDDWDLLEPSNGDVIAASMRGDEIHAEIELEREKANAIALKPVYNKQPTFRMEKTYPVQGRRA